VTINGQRQYLWRAVDQHGAVLDILLQPKRDARAAARFFRKLLTKQGRTPRVLVTDKLRSYGAAHRKVMPTVEHRTSKYLNNRAENSHQPTRERERAMKGFRSVGAGQRFLGAFSRISPHFRARKTHDDRTQLPDRDDQQVHHLARDHRHHHIHHRITHPHTNASACPQTHTPPNNLTTPYHLRRWSVARLMSCSRPVARSGR
jgi:hypothetical protein